VSHQPERKEKDCLNCGTLVQGRFCQHCGQENIVTKQTFWSLATHFVFDIFHFDGKFFDTLGTLLFRPGKVAREYISGKRVRYLDPVRMYLFTSALFFLVFFAVTKPKISGDLDDSFVLTNTDRISVLHNLANEKDSAGAFHKYVVGTLLDTSQVILFNAGSSSRDSLIWYNGKGYKMEHYSTRHLEDSINKKSWIDRAFQKKFRKAAENKQNDENAAQTIIGEMLHRLPYLLFVSLPFFALILKLVYVRRKQFYYSDHIIFTLYHYIFSFFLLLLVIGFKELANLSSARVFTWMSTLLMILWLVYLYKGMKVFYGQSRKKTILKFFLVNLLGIFSFILIVFVFLTLSAFEF
jgi:hypothetical protein